MGCSSVPVLSVAIKVVDASLDVAELDRTPIAGGRGIAQGAAVGGPAPVRVELAGRVWRRTAQPAPDAMQVDSLSAMSVCMKNCWYCWPGPVTGSESTKLPGTSGSDRRRPVLVLCRWPRRNAVSLDGGEVGRLLAVGIALRKPLRALEAIDRQRGAPVGPPGCGRGEPIATALELASGNLRPVGLARRGRVPGDEVAGGSRGGRACGCGSAGAVVGG